MKTNDFIDMLAAGVTPVERGVPARRLGSALAVAAVGAVLLMTIAFGVRPDLSAVMRTPIFWAKLAFPICVAAGDHGDRTARPPRRDRRCGPAGGRRRHRGGLDRGPLCGRDGRIRRPARGRARSDVARVSVQHRSAVGARFRCDVRRNPGLAPTRLRTAGAAAGLAASAIATIAYCFHCPEMSPAFWGVWYLLGMALPAALGALVAPIWLRW